MGSTSSLTRGGGGRGSGSILSFGLTTCVEWKRVEHATRLRFVSKND